MAPNRTVLIVDDDRSTRWVLSHVLDAAGFACAQAGDGEEAVRLAQRLHPDLILMDISMPRLGGLAALQQIRRDSRMLSTPIIFLTANGALDSVVEHLTAGADDYLVKPVAPAELVARATQALRRSEALRDLSPLTGLPGNGAISREMAKRIAAGRQFACMHADIDDFKAYNDAYGFARGDVAIAAASDVLLVALRAAPDDQHFLGHIGGDDFLVLTSPGLSERLAREMTRRFDAVAPLLYDPADRERGYVEVRDRTGAIRQVVIMSLSIGIAMSGSHPRSSAAELAAYASEMKTVAKRRPGSTFAIDRRRATPANDEPAAASDEGAAYTVFRDD